MKLHPKIAPNTVAVFPLLKRDGLPEKAREVVEILKTHFKTIYDQQGSIGKRYYRQDEAGTPFCITIDHQTLETDNITIRYRDTQKQDSISIDKVISVINSNIT